MKIFYKTAEFDNVHINLNRELDAIEAEIGLGARARHESWIRRVFQCVFPCCCHKRPNLPEIEPMEPPSPNIQKQLAHHAFKVFGSGTDGLTGIDKEEEIDGLKGQNLSALVLEVQQKWLALKQEIDTRISDAKWYNGLFFVKGLLSGGAALFLATMGAIHAKNLVSSDAQGVLNYMEILFPAAVLAVNKWISSSQDRSLSAVRALARDAFASKFVTIDFSN